MCHESRAVLAANVHMVMEARDDPRFHADISLADLALADGMPLVWCLRSLGIKAKHVRGTDVMVEVCRLAEVEGLAVGLYGGTPEVLAGVQRRLAERFPKLNITLAISPPFRTLTSDEERETSGRIRATGTSILFVSLGCPKQERWIIRHRQEQLPCVMLGVGAAFGFLAGSTPQAPRWMQQIGGEWLFRLATDPRRLWKRYARTIPRFVVLFSAQYCRHLFARLLRRRNLSTSP
jgi:N-acetylglucosaminyldiphosphoundecaprenol N-acetyl-beta-D-mannosaminyltransferase